MKFIRGAVHSFYFGVEVLTATIAVERLLSAMNTANPDLVFTYLWGYLGYSAALICFIVSHAYIFVEEEVNDLS